MGIGTSGIPTTPPATYEEWLAQMEKVKASGKFAIPDQTQVFNSVASMYAVRGDKAISADAVRSLANLPPREVLLAKLAGGMQAPLGTLAGLLTANIRNLGYALAQVRDQKAQAEGA